MRTVRTQITRSNPRRKKRAGGRGYERLEALKAARAAGVESGSTATPWCWKRTRRRRSR